MGMSPTTWAGVLSVPAAVFAFTALLYGGLRIILGVGALVTAITANTEAVRDLGSDLAQVTADVTELKHWRDLIQGAHL